MTKIKKSASVVYGSSIYQIGVEAKLPITVSHLRLPQPARMLATGTEMTWFTGAVKWDIWFCNPVLGSTLLLR